MNGQNEYGGLTIAGKEVWTNGFADQNELDEDLFF